MRGQLSSEYLLLIVFVVVIVSLFMIDVARDAEITVAIAATRLACSEYSNTVDSEVYCTTISYSINGTNFTVSPHLYNYRGIRVVPLPASSFNERVIQEIRGSITNNRSVSCTNCVDCSIGHYYYCVDASV
ncbi:hypothetical protein H0O03_01890 [Candidatus Micrarchaeota archaeon]|nr:hypothetical protein [Candidatus Micrarchaeota archaeon]